MNCQRTRTEQNLPLWSYWVVMHRYSITLRRNECYILSFPICKVQIFWAGLKKLAHLPPFLWKNLVVSNYKWVKICGLLRISELFWLTRIVLAMEGVSEYYATIFPLLGILRISSNFCIKLWVNWIEISTFWC